MTRTRERKTCPTCRRRFTRPMGQSPSTWATRRHCGRACTGRVEVGPGDRFGRWTVVAFADWLPQGQTRWHVRCRCGGAKIVSASHLVQGKSRSCGCLRREVARARAYTLPAWTAHWARAPKPPRRAAGAP